VRTTRIERRGLERERRTGIRRRMEFEGAWAAEFERVDEALGGRTRSACATARRAACRLRWGRSDEVVEGGEVEVDGSLGLELSEVAFLVAIELDSGIVEVKAPLLELERAFSSRALAEKYPARNRGVVPVPAALTFDVREKFLVTERDGVFAVCKRHDRHMVLRPLGRKALAGGYRIIIACRECLIEALGFEVSFSRA
jgi:hypothetical protein